ncbi:hypothetical protein GW17_00022787, partial [Ensete ventricosum]
VSVGFLCTISEFQNTGHSQCIHGKSYEHGFVKKHDSNKLCAKSSFDQFFVHCLETSKYWPFPTY